MTWDFGPTATHQEIEEKFGPVIAALVDGLTKIAKLDLVTKEAAQVARTGRLENKGGCRVDCFRPPANPRGGLPLFPRPRGRRNRR